MTPEISRRCSYCGAAIRERDALFCPECGKALPTVAQSAGQIVPPTATSEQHEQPSEGVSYANVSHQPASNDPSSQAVAPDVATSEPNWKQPPQPGAGDQREASIRRNATEVRHDPGRVHPRMERTRETLHRASTVARGVIEDEVKRVEKIRHVSSVVIEEASYDPSLRFVLVALGLFILFLILLVVSKVMG